MRMPRSSSFCIVFSVLAIITGSRYFVQRDDGLPGSPVPYSVASTLRGRGCYLCADYIKFTCVDALEHEHGPVDCNILICPAGSVRLPDPVAGIPDTPPDGVYCGINANVCYELPSGYDACCTEEGPPCP
jgi:hypothetical protein